MGMDKKIAFPTECHLKETGSILIEKEGCLHEKVHSISKKPKLA